MTIATTRTPERLPSEVALLRNRIKEIQSNCTHKWKHFTEALSLTESISKGVYIVGKQGDRISFEIMCTDCDLSKKLSAAETCYQCLTPLTTAEWATRSIYFDEVQQSSTHYGCKTAHCPNCNYAVAFEEWDR